MSVSDRLNRPGTVAVEVAVQPQPSTANMLVQRCALCLNDILLDAGDVTFGGEWYHASCWALGRITVEEEAAEKAPVRRTGLR